MLHKTANENTNSVSYYDPDKAKVQKLATSGTAYRHWSDYSQSSASANSTTGVDMNKKFNLNFNAGYQRLMTVMFRGYISGGAYYFSWAIKNFTTGNMVPCMLNGVTSIALMKIDVLDKLKHIKICTEYFDSYGKIVPGYETMLGWNTSTVGITKIEDLPEEAKKYIARIEELVGVEVGLISTGPERNQTILKKDLFF